ncbi:MAG: hypothetical protein QW478_10560 [Candidatus Micrarchaeaceae archaeon]
MMIRRSYNVPKVILHKTVSTHPLIISPTKGSIQPERKNIQLKKGSGPIISPHLIGPIGPVGGINPILPVSPITRLILPISPINDYRKPPIYPINPVIPYHPITISPVHPISITPIHPTQIIQQKVQKTTTTPAKPQPDDSGAIGAGLGALVSIFLSLI